MFKKLIYSLNFVIILKASAVFASACCGGGFAMPSLITGDEKAILTTAYSYSKVDTDVTDQGVWIKRSADELTSKTIKLDAAIIFNDRYQAGVSVPVITRTKAGSVGGESSGLADVSTMVGYEYLPDWDYNPCRPHGVGFVSLTWPTGKSIQESDSISGVDSRGRGFWALGLGTTLTKNILEWDVNSTLEVHRSFDKSVHNSSVDGTIKPGLGGSFSVGAGYNIQDLRLGTSLAFTYEDPVQVQASTTTAGSVERYATASLLTSYLFDKEWAGTVAYADQTLFGSPVRTTLSKSISISIQRKWSR